MRTDKTEEYLQKILNRLILPGSLFLAVIAIIPTLIEDLFKIPAEQFQCSWAELHSSS
jgi:preprotein translocase subunit SecY